MRLRWILAACTVGVMAPGLAQAAPQAGALPIATQEYLRTAAQSDKFEITEGRIAAAVSPSPAVRAFAQQMVRDHTDSTVQLMAAAAEAGAPMDKPTLAGDQQQMLIALEIKTGADFDREYLKQQLTAHKVALSIQSDYAQNGASGPIRSVARRIVPVVQGHLSMLQSMTPN